MVKLLQKLEESLGRLLLGGEALPQASEMHDDGSNAGRGYSFLAHPDNIEWVAGAERYLIARAVGDKEYGGDWIHQGSLNHARFKVYQAEVAAFLVLLSAAIHLTGGIPVRLPRP
jgi:hypothetical protein